MRYKLCRIILAGIAYGFTGFASAAPGGAFHSGEVQDLIDRAGREPAFAEQPVTVIIEDGPASAIRAHASAAGATLRYSVGKRHEVSIRGNRLSQLISLLPATSVVRLSYPHQPLAVTSQGVALTGGGDMQAIGNNGAGIKVGVIDLGFASLASAQASGDLPSNLSIVDYTGTGTGGIDHGTNVAQIVYDMAPGSQLYLAKISTDVQLYQAINDMVAAGVQVINHSVGWYGAAFYDGTGPICDSVNQAVAGNAQWVNAMGNDRFRHYMAVLTDTNNDKRHEFATGQNYNTVILYAGVPVDFVLNWDAYPTTSTDYNLYLFNGNPGAGGVQVAKSDTRQIGSIPYEHIAYTPSVNGTYYIVVQKYRTNTANVRFALFAFGVDLGVMTQASSLTQPADCAGAIGVAATYPDNDIPEYYSSEGPTTDGRAKPEVAAPDRVQTSLTSSFAGTSAASPHVAGAVALLRAQNPTFTLDQIKWLLTSTAKDVYTAGYDYRTGNGRISLDADGDGFNHDTDNCPLVTNANQLNTDGDMLGNACDADDDNDGLSDAFELSIGTNPLLVDTDGDGLTDGIEVNTYGTSPTLSNKGDLAPSNAPDGQINMSDLMLLLRFVEQLQVPTALDLTLGDMNNDGALDVRDILRLRRQLGY